MTSRIRALRTILGLGLAGLGAVGALTAAVRWMSWGRIVTVSQLPRLPVALVLGAQVHPDLVPSGFLAARLDVAAQLYARGLVEHLLLSGDGRSRFYDEPATMAAYLIGRGVPESAITTDPQGLDTFASCRRAREEYGWRELVVVSQSYHLPRAIAICALLGIDAWGVGDESMRRNGRIWSYGTLREVGANLKIGYDLLAYLRERKSTGRS
jgi:vancomycin permeability regulator SanA